MKLICQIFLLCITCIFCYQRSNAQLQITAESNAQALVQKLLGPGVTVSNVTLTGHPAMTGIFNNISGTNIGIDSGIVLTNGRAKTIGAGSFGMDGDGINTALNVNAFNQWGFPGDPDLSAIVAEETNDACVLEFDFVPLGDSIRFNYVFSSEEYTDFSCTEFNDAFAFFISGPGITGLKNIALIPNTSLPVTINNINEKACALFPQYFVNNEPNKFFTHNGHIKVFTAREQVVPCQSYHLKLVIADVFDDDLDSGVFLEAGSLSSNAISIENITQVDPSNNYYLVEGCSAGSFKIKRPNAESSPLNVSLSYAGTATNGIDMQLLPTTVTIPANQSEVIVNVIPVIDNMPEGIELIKIYALAGGGCSANLPTDSTIIQIRDYDTLGIVPDTAFICKNTSVQLTAYNGYTSYQWDNNPTLSSLIIRNPIATPVNEFTTYYCTSSEGTCHGRDSAFVQWKKLDLVSKTEINCKDAATGEIQVDGGAEWTAPVEYSFNNGAWQTGNIFSNLPIGIYKVKIRDATGCIDSLDIPITQLYPDLLINSTLEQAASCLGIADGSTTINIAGGKSPYLYSLDGINFQSSNVFNLMNGSYTVFVKDDNGCTVSQNIVITLNNIVTLEAGADLAICEGKSVQINTTSNANTFIWSPAATLDNSALQSPVANPVTTTKYYVTATSGICNQFDSVTVFVNPAPTANAGPDASICFGKNAQLSGSGGVSYFWSPSSSLNNNRIQNPTTINLPGSITYSLHVVDANGCNSLKKDDVVITVTRQAIVDAPRDTVLAVGVPLSLYAVDVNNVGFTQYEWLPYYGLNNPLIANPTAILDKDITYTVTARTALGCVATDKIKIQVYRGPEIYVPNAFTPNRDSKNDILKAIPVGIRSFSYFRIYDRWGSLVFSTTDPSIGWDGRIKGTEQSTATYVWMAEGIDYTGKVVRRKGSVIIIK
ncbi:MAG: choice-of-anchor L domain-containing protein [Chitinophagaceae bacterium]|nr:choice-of-anchor L domain-containing protein [Chitinophagaceae bacterium]